MSEEYRNIYKIPRVKQGWTQESAAERLAVSVESIRAYETGQRIPPNEVVAEMVVQYEDKDLGYLHLRHSNCLARSIIPQFNTGLSLSQATLQLINHIYAFADRNSDRRLVAIAADNIISPEERDTFDAILRELQEIVAAAMALRYSESEDGAER